jgi:hypothetical protein
MECSLQGGSQQDKAKTNDDNSSQIRRNLHKNLKETMELVMESFCPIDDESNDNEYQTGIRQETKRPLHTPDDKQFTKEEIERMISTMDINKAPGENGITA